MTQKELFLSLFPTQKIKDLLKIIFFVLAFENTITKDMESHFPLINDLDSAFVIIKKNNKAKNYVRWNALITVLRKK